MTRTATTTPSAASLAAVDELVERMGLLWEIEGLPRIAGRIFGFLMLQPGACHIGEIAERLGVSKASVSVDARRLERLGLIQRVGRPGDRRDYYAIGDDVFVRSIETKLEGLRRLQSAISAARRIPGAAPAVRKRLADWEHLHDRALQAMESMLDDLRAADADALAPAE